MKRKVFTLAQRSVIRRLQSGRRLFCDDVSRRRALYWIKIDGEGRSRGPSWRAVRELENRGYLTVTGQDVNARRELVIRLTEKGAAS